MARAVYPKYKEAILSGGSNTDLVGLPVKWALVDTGVYTYSAAHQFFTSLTGVVGTPQPVLGTKTVTDGLFKTSASISTVSASGPDVEAIVYYIETGTGSTSRLVYYDDASLGLPLTPTGTVTLNFAASGIFQL